MTCCFVAKKGEEIGSMREEVLYALDIAFCLLVIDMECSTVD